MQFIKTYTYKTTIEPEALDSQEYDVTVHYYYSPSCPDTRTDPGEPEEFELIQVLDKQGGDITQLLTEAETEKLYTELCENADDHVPEPPEFDPFDVDPPDFGFDIDDREFPL